MDQRLAVCIWVYPGVCLAGWLPFSVPPAGWRGKKYLATSLAGGPAWLGVYVCICVYMYESTSLEGLTKTWLTVPIRGPLFY